MKTTVGAEPAVLDALAAAAAAFPIADLEQQPGEVVEIAAEHYPEGGGRWAAVAFDGERPGIVAVVVSFDVASGLFNTKGQAPKLAASIKAATAGLGVEDGEVTTGRGNDALPEFPAGAPVTITAMRLLSAGEHVVTLLIAQADRRGEDPTAPADFPPVDEATVAPPVRTAIASADARALSVIRSVEMNVTAELGRSSMTVRELLELGPGSVIELDRAAGSPVDLLVNGTIIARGEVVVIDEEYGIRVSEIIGSPDDL